MPTETTAPTLLTDGAGSVTPRQVYRTELNPVSFLRRTAALYPDRVAVVHATHPLARTYREFAERVWRLGSALQRAGLQRGDRVALLSPNTPAMLEAHFAVPAAGGIMVPLSTRLTSNDIASILRHAGARGLIVDAELSPLVASLDLSGIIVIPVDDTGEPSDPYEAFLASGSPEELPEWLDDEEATISINYTSGTTGQPKGVMATYRGSYLNGLANIIEMHLDATSRHLYVGPLFHCNGWCYPWAVTAVGGTHVCLRRVDPGLIWELFETHGITSYHGSPTVHISLVHHPSARRLDRAIGVMSGGAPPSPTLIAGMGRLNLRLLHAYGLTETYAPFTLALAVGAEARSEADEQARLQARQGQAHVTADLARVVDERLNDVPRDGQTLGEVVMRGNIVMKGYYADPEATEQAFEGSWFHSGDLGVLHPDGAIELRDRKKDIIISGGENISTIEVEQTIVQHPAVLDCAVVAIPDERWGERPKAFVTLKPGAVATEREIIDYCRERLAHFKGPAAVAFGELPKTSTGKTQKYVLREQEWAGRDRRIH